MHEIEHILLPDHRGNAGTVLVLWPDFKKGQPITLLLLIDCTIMNVYKIIFFNDLLLLKAKCLRHLLF